jgi:hypothetical protein
MFGFLVFRIQDEGGGEGEIYSFESLRKCNYD